MGGTNATANEEQVAETVLWTDCNPHSPLLCTTLRGEVEEGEW